MNVLVSCLIVYVPLAWLAMLLVWIFFVTGPLEFVTTERDHEMLSPECREFRASHPGPPPALLFNGPGNCSGPTRGMALRLIRCLLAAVVALAPVAACDLSHAHFPIAVANRMANSVSVLADGQRIGDVGPNLIATFSVEESLSGSVGNPASPTPIAQVTFSVRDMATGTLSAGAGATPSRRMAATSLPVTRVSAATASGATTRCCQPFETGRPSRIPATLARTNSISDASA